MEKILLIIPAYNEAKNLPLLINEINKKASNVDIVVVNDCSKDNTLDVCRDLKVNVLNLPVNLGIGGAMQTGYKYAYENSYDIAIQVDGDGQHDPKYIDLLVQNIREGNNMCLGSRFIEKTGFQSTFTRRIGIVYFSKLIKIITGSIITDPTSGFRACDRETIKLFNDYYPVDYPEPETLVLLKKHKMKIKEVAVEMKERKEGESSIKSFKSIYYMIKVSLAIVITWMSSKNQ